MHIFRACSSLLHGSLTIGTHLARSTKTVESSPKTTWEARSKARHKAQADGDWGCDSKPTGAETEKRAYICTVFSTVCAGTTGSLFHSLGLNFYLYLLIKVTEHQNTKAIITSFMKNGRNGYFGLTDRRRYSKENRRGIAIVPCTQVALIGEIIPKA
jgi:hypothetical protein